MSIQLLDILVADVDSVLGVFDQLQVWRSPDQNGDPTPYAPITAASATSAVVDGSAQGPWDLSGLDLTIVLDGSQPQTISFTGENPLTINAVIDQINSTFQGLAKKVPNDLGKLRLESPSKGLVSELLVSGNAAAVLGLSADRAMGLASHINLAPGTTKYVFKDFNGAATDWYQTRLYSSSTGAIGALSAPFQANPSTVLPVSQLVRCFAYLADGAGRPVVDRRIILVPVGQVNADDGSGNIYGVLPGVDRLVVTTNQKGYAETYLTRGQTFRVFFEGTTIQRTFTVPAVGADLNLLTVVSDVDDPFSIVQSPPMPIRVS